MITLENERLLVNISTGRGARIEKFFDKENNKNWVWKPDISQPDENQNLNLEAGFDDHWAGGWEEVFPNDAPCEVESFRLVDHGEVWRRAWRIEKRSENQVFCELNCETYPVSISKSLELNSTLPELTIKYRILSHATKTIPFIFKFHPALKIEENDRFIMPSCLMTPVALGFSRILGNENTTLYPEGIDSEGRKCSLEFAKPNDGFLREFVKLEKLRSPEAALFNLKSKTQLKFLFSKDFFQYLWLFQSFGGFLGHYVSMIEPMNAGHYDLSTAFQEGQCGVLKPKDEVEFFIKIGINDIV